MAIFTFKKIYDNHLQLPCGDNIGNAGDFQGNNIACLLKCFYQVDQVGAIIWLKITAIWWLNSIFWFQPEVRFEPQYGII